MLKNLHKLDKKLWMKLDIEICGASAAAKDRKYQANLKKELDHGMDI